MIHSILAKIFLWFWLAMAVVAISVAVTTMAGGPLPFGRRWMSLMLNQCAHGAVYAYQHQGAAGLEDYLREVERSPGIRTATLLDAGGRNLSGGASPPRVAGLQAETRGGREAWSRNRATWTGVAQVATLRGDFLFVGQFQPLLLYASEADVQKLIPRLAIALLSAGLLCLLLARHITAPIRALQGAARRIADGDLSVRALPAIPPRNDELAELARDFDRMAARIEALLQKQQEMLGDISHELRSPLTRLTVSLELAQRGEIDALDHMQADLRQLDALIGQILTLTRLEAREGHKGGTVVNLRTIVESVAEDASFEGKEKGKSVRVERADDCWANGDPALLRSAIENVVRNAIRYTRPQTAVEMTLDLLPRGTSTAARIVVADRGTGVPPGALSRLFEPFYRVEESRNAWSGGTGLGLSISQRVVQLYGGTIVARNREGGGLEMEMCFPARSDAGARHPL